MCVGWLSTDGSTVTDQLPSHVSGGSRIFERGVQADYGNSTDCFIMASEYIYAEAAKSVPIHTKGGKFSDLRSHLLAFQVPYSEHWSGGCRNCRICSNTPVGLIASFCSWPVKLTITSQRPCRQIFLPHCILIERICRQS